METSGGELRRGAVQGSHSSDNEEGPETSPIPRPYQEASSDEDEWEQVENLEGEKATNEEEAQPTTSRMATRKRKQ